MRDPARASTLHSRRARNLGIVQCLDRVKINTAALFYLDHLDDGRIRPLGLEKCCGKAFANRIYLGTPDMHSLVN